MSSMPGNTVFALHNNLSTVNKWILNQGIQFTLWTNLNLDAVKSVQVVVNPGSGVHQQFGMSHLFDTLDLN